jgi:hypothetical protein
VPYTDGQTIVATITENDLNPATDAFHINITIKNLTAESLNIRTLCIGEIADDMIAEVCFGDGCYWGEFIALDWTVDGGDSEIYKFALAPEGNF